MSHLETAAFTLHIMLRTRRNHRVFAGRVFSSLFRAFGLPTAAQPTDAANTLAFFTSRHAPLAICRRGRFTWKDSF
jgi:hypothetical protein